MNLDTSVNAATDFLYLLLISAWVVGVAIVKGFWMTLVCFIAPPISWIVLAQFILKKFGLM